jgi:hypothetical protein
MRGSTLQRSGAPGWRESDGNRSKFYFEGWLFPGKS